MRTMMSKSLLAFLSIVLFINLSSCKKNSTKSDVITEQWEVVITFVLNDTYNSTFQEFGDLEVEIDGEDVTITGTYTIGNLVYEDIVFYGKLEDDEFTLFTNTYTVQFVVDNITYTEQLTFKIEEFNYDDESATANGNITIFITPGDDTQTGTFTLVANKI